MKLTRRQWITFNGATLAAAIIPGLASLEAAAQIKPAFPAGSYGAKILQRGKLIVGVRYDIPLYGFQNPKTGEVEGFEVDMAKELAKALFGDPGRIEFKQTVSRTRIPMLQEGVVDVVIANLTQTKQRMNEIDFSDVYNLSGASALVADASPIRRNEDLRGKTLAMTKGGTGEQTVRQMFPESKLVLLETHAECFEALVSRRADAFIADETTHQGMRKKLQGYRILTEHLTFEPHAIGIAKGRGELVEFVNAFLRDFKASGKWKELYRKNIGEPVPDPPQGTPDPKWLR